MIIEEFIKDENRLSVLQRSISALNSINAFGLFLEIGARRAEASPNDRPMEYAALRAAFHEGYTEALRDIHDFFDRYTKRTQETAARPDFNAAKELLQRNEISSEEYEQLTGSKPIP